MNDNEDSPRFGQRLAEKVARVAGSWKFIIVQTLIISVWVVLNVTNMISLDRFPFIFLNLCLSLQAAYTAPLILIAQNRQSEIDRQILHHDFVLDEDTNTRIMRIEEKIDRLLDRL